MNNRTLKFSWLLGVGLHETAYIVDPTRTMLDSQIYIYFNVIDYVLTKRLAKEITQAIDNTILESLRNLKDG